MNHRISCNHCWITVTVLLFGLGTQCAYASGVPITGSYEVIEKTDLGSRTKVLLRLHLMNHNQGELYLRKIVLWDFGYPPCGAARASSIALHSGTSENVVQEFVIPRLQLEQWQRGLLPRVVLELQTTTGARITQALHLGRVLPERVSE